MKKILLVVIMTLFSVNSFAEDFRGWDWGMTTLEVEKLSL